MQIKTRKYIFHLLDWQKYKWFLISSVAFWWLRQAVGAGEGHSHLLMLMSKSELYKFFRGQLTVPLKFWMCLPFDKPFHSQASVSQQSSNYITSSYKDVHTTWLIGKNQRQPKCPNIRGLLKKLWQIQTIQYPGFIFRNTVQLLKKNEFIFFKEGDLNFIWPQEFS